MTKLPGGAVFVLLASLAWGAEARWIRMPSADFEIYSSAGEGDTRRILQDFERVRQFFEETTGGKIQTAEPVRVIVFGSKKEYAPYRPNEFAAAYYTQISGRDYIVMGDTGDAVVPIAVHEYVHLVVEHTGLKLPPWLNEGIAEVYSTMRPLGDKVIVGAVVPGRIQAMQRMPWVPLSEIVAADRNSPYYNEKSKAGSLYNEGWALTHMLELTKEYRPQFNELLNQIQRGVPSQQALEKIYGKPLAQFDREVQAYVRQDRLNAGVFSLKLQTGDKVAAETAPAFDVKLALTDLTLRPGMEAESRRRLEELAMEDPLRPEPEVGLGYLSWRENNPGEAVKSFAKAYELGSRNPQMLWDYGRMAMAADMAGSARALGDLLAKQPDRMDVRLALAQTQMNARQPKLVLETLSAVKSVKDKDAPVLFRLLALADSEVGKQEEARKAAARWRDTAREPDDKQMAEQFRVYLDQPKGDAPAPAQAIQWNASDAVAAPDSPGGRPRLVRNRLPGKIDLSKPAEPLPFVDGTMTELDCGGKIPKLILTTGTGKVAFLMEDPRTVMLSGLGSATVDMNCGPQKAAVVWLEYEPLEVPHDGALGSTRAIHFEGHAKR